MAHISKVLAMTEYRRRSSLYDWMRPEERIAPLKMEISSGTIFDSCIDINAYFDMMVSTSVSKLPGGAG